MVVTLDRPYRHYKARTGARVSRVMVGPDWGFGGRLYEVLIDLGNSGARSSATPL
jgi:hypothetical protein